MKLLESGEMYLETILILQNKNGAVRSLDVAEYMGFSKPSVSRAMGLLRSGGYIETDKNGFITLTDRAEFLYRADRFYAPEAEGSIRWNDPELAVDWKTDDPILSEKDRHAPFLKDAVTGY